MSTRYALGDHAYTARQLAALLEEQPSAAPQVAAALRTPKPKSRGVDAKRPRPGALPPWPTRTGLYLVDVAQYSTHDIQVRQVRKARGVALYVSEWDTLVMTTSGQQWRKHPGVTLYECRPVYPHSVDGIAGEVMDATQIETAKTFGKVIHPTMWGPGSHAGQVARAEASERVGASTWATRLSGQVDRVFATTSPADRRAELIQLAAMALTAITHMRLED